MKNPFMKKPLPYKDWLSLPIPEGGLAREIMRDHATDMAVLQHRAAKRFNERKESGNA